MNPQFPTVYKQYPPANGRLAEKFVLRLPDGMRTDLAERARDHKRSMNSEIIEMLEAQLNGVMSNPQWIPAIGQLVSYEGKAYTIKSFHESKQGVIARLDPIGLQVGTFETRPTDPEVLLFELTPVKL